MKYSVSAVAVLLSIWSISSSANLAEAPVVFKSGSWNVHRTTDTMTDKTSCTGIYNNDFGIQLTDDTLFISIRGSLRGYQFRFDDQPVSQMYIANDTEERMDTIIIKANFKKTLGSDRLRVKALTYNSSKDYDLDLSGIVDAVQNIRSGCPGEPVNGVVASDEETLLCGAKVVTRLKEKGVSKETIDYACAE